MSSLPLYNLPAFKQAADALRALGHEVFNPGENGAEALLDTDPTLIDKLDFRRRVFRADTAYICDHAEVIALLPGWHRSRGARAEVALADAIGIPAYPIERFVR